LRANKIESVWVSSGVQMEMGVKSVAGEHLRVD
ncbi:uncharacterized, partial [Tachysurus ichikawai]